MTYKIAVQKSNYDATMVKLAKKLDSNPFSRCVEGYECIDRVKMGSSVYIDVLIFI